jgi:hypothetical protein
MASRPRTRSWSQSEDDSDTPSLTHGEKITRSKRKNVPLETVIASPEPEPAKKLSFTPANETTTPRSEKKSAKKTAMKSSTKKNKASTTLEPIADEPSKEETSGKSAKKKVSGVEASLPSTPSNTKEKDVKKLKPSSSKNQNDAVESEHLNKAPLSNKKLAQKRKHVAESKLNELIDGTSLLEANEEKRWQVNVHRCRFVGWMPDPILTLIALPAHLNGNVVAVRTICMSITLLKWLIFQCITGIESRW